MANRYLELIEKRARQELEDLNRAQQRAIIEAYNSAGKQLVRSYRGARDGTATKALLASYTQKVAEETQQIIEQYAIKGAQIAPSVEKLIMQEAFRMAGLDTSLANDKFDNIIGKLGMESVKNVIGGKIYKDGAGLSARIWQASAMANNRIQEIITAGLAQDMGAAKLSKLLQDYVNSTARKTWDNKKIREILGGSYARWNGNLEYNALRLARTTLAHTATMSMRQAQKINPYATKIMWHSVHAAGRTCSICEEMDGQVYDTDKCPFDHPNGMCYQTHEFDKSLDEIADELAAWCRGEENEMLDSWWRTVGGTDDERKDRLSFKRISVQELKKMAEENPYNRKYSYREQRALVKKDDPTAQIALDNEEIYKGYVGSANSFSVNQHLYSTQSNNISEKYKRTVSALDSAISSYECPNNVVLRRFVDDGYLFPTFGTDNVEKLQKFIGNVYENKSFMSTSINGESMYNRQCLMTIQCPTGTKMFATTNYEEGEIVLARNTRYEIIDVVDRRNNPLPLAHGDFKEIEIIVRIVDR